MSAPLYLCRVSLITRSRSSISLWRNLTVSPIATRCRFDNRSVVFAIAVDHVTTAHKRGEGALIRQEASSENETSFFAKELAELFFKLFMDAEIAVEKAGARAARSEFLDRAFCCGLYAGLWVKPK
ncbi:unnamed protein product [Sphagnum jensenii]|uniref:Uncharacterized protein n=1 Tax=Sphagnum jensenii TaxID=128206 RepID=A0ABP0V8N8_9BRYO